MEADYLLFDAALEAEEEYLAAFIERAIEPVADSGGEGSEEEYLELFMAHSMEEPETFLNVMSSPAAESGLGLKYSRFVSSYSELDPDSGIGIIRLTSAAIPGSGINVYSRDATLLCYTLLGEGEVVVDGRGIKCRKYDCVWLDCSRRAHYRASPGQSWECAFVRVHGRMDSHLFAETCRRMREDGVSGNALPLSHLAAAQHQDRGLPRPGFRLCTPAAEPLHGGGPRCRQLLGKAAHCTGHHRCHTGLSRPQLQPQHIPGRPGAYI